MERTVILNGIGRDWEPKRLSAILSHFMETVAMEKISLYGTDAHIVFKGGYWIHIPNFQKQFPHLDSKVQKDLNGFFVKQGKLPKAFALKKNSLGIVATFTNRRRVLALLCAFIATASITLRPNTVKSSASFVVASPKVQVAHQISSYPLGGQGQDGSLSSKITQLIKSTTSYGTKDYQEDLAVLFNRPLEEMEKLPVDATLDSKLIIARDLTTGCDRFGSWGANNETSEEKVSMLLDTLKRYNITDPELIFTILAIQEVESQSGESYASTVLNNDLGCTVKDKNDASKDQLMGFRTREFGLDYGVRIMLNATLKLKKENKYNDQIPFIANLQPTYNSEKGDYYTGGILERTKLVCQKYGYDYNAMMSRYDSSLLTIYTDAYYQGIKADQKQKTL